MSFFSAIFPPDDVVEELHDALRPVRAAHPRLRWVRPARWHVTVRFFGEVEPTRPLDGLDRVTAPVLRLRGSGTFRHVLWIGVDGPLAELGEAARVPPDWRPHLTVARGAGLPHVEFTGREWTATEVALVRSRPAEGYAVLDRVPLSTSNA
ncbi:RNA 2',3'-cyclic phosphodiesterase [Saccharothrix sp. S26]|uniref:2'-5' RNA ligase family protein n=1 Tax=Saccharothrix sp. S26 TaxID=2907215 RepID=UPI001F4540BD|nr:2'-5' RNA ligase family protein [Saccharothrix sp. S26]MCE6993708.1 RNA 2',3'-cyclic phosphodiesterase [Saccharothrix sp. S26]